MADAGKDHELKLNKGGNKKKMLLMVLVLVLAGVAAVAFLMLKGSDSSQGGEGTSQVEASQVDPNAKKAFYVPVQSPFVFVASARPRGHTVQVKVSLRVRGPNDVALAVHHLPAIEGAITKATTEVSYDQISNGEGKDDLKRIILKNIQTRFKELESKPVVEAVMYDGFIVQ